MHTNVRFEITKTQRAMAPTLYSLKDERVPHADVYASSDARASGKLRAIAEQHLDLALETTANERSFALIITNAGEILVVRYRYGNWCYEIHREGQVSPASCSGAPTFQQAVMDARRHAETGFDGIAWQSVTPLID